MRERNGRRGRGDVKGGESPVREKRCWNAVTEEEEERAEKGGGATRKEELGGERRTEDERRGNEKRKDRAAPDSAALIFNDILGRAGVPLMHGHYNMLLSFSLSLSVCLSVFLSLSLLSFCPL